MKKINLRNNELKELEQKFKDQIEYVEQNIMKMELEQDQMNTKKQYVIKFFKDNMDHNQKIMDDLKNVYDQKYSQTSEIA